MCKGSYINKTALFVSVGVVASLLLVFIIVTSIRCVYKPLRPRIKKTYVVHKNVTPTPLTCRPTTEQCEITIENCCNMNICDTVSRIIYYSYWWWKFLSKSSKSRAVFFICNSYVCYFQPCFDPKTLQAEAAKKDDKKFLLNHSDGDLMYWSFDVDSFADCSLRMRYNAKLLRCDIVRQR